MKKSKKQKPVKEAKVLGVETHIEDDMKVTTTTKLVTPDTDVVTTPWGTTVKANDVTKVLEEYYALSLEDRTNEKNAWVALISKMMGEREDGLKIVDIELAPDGSRQVKFVYR